MVRRPPRPRPLRRLLLCALLPLCASCGRPTEIVIRLVAVDTPPPFVTVKLHRMTPFADNPAMTPGFVVSSINGADLDLAVMLQGHETVLSLLPNKNAGNDLRVTVLAPGWQVSPAGPQDTMFVEDKSTELRFEIAGPPPDGGVRDGGRDMAVPRSDGGGDGGKPVDMAARG